MQKLYSIQLSAEQRRILQQLVSAGTNKARVLARARAMLLLDQGHSDKEVNAALSLSANTVQRIRKRYAEQGFEAALYDQPHPGRPVVLGGEVEAKLVMLACSDPPKGQARWSLVLLADKMVELHYCPAISREQVRLILKKTACSPGAKSNGAFPKPIAAL